MNMRGAVAAAKFHLMQLFQEENITNVGLEEAEYDENRGQWRVTISFTRNWQPLEEGGALSAAIARAALDRQRSHKVVTIDNGDGEIVSVKNREMVT
jgi:hypothetical protein